MSDNEKNWGDRLKELKVSIADKKCPESGDGKHTFASLKQYGEVDVFFCQHCLTYRYKHKGGITSGYPRAYKNT
jgi:hypothetical protein